MNKTPNTILVIDDNEINRKYLKSVISNNNFEALVAATGFEAFQILEKQKIDLILVDIQMPEMDGFECYRQIKSRFQVECPILAITAFSDLADRKEIIAFGFNDYIIKPVKPNVLLDTISYWLTSYSEIKEGQQNKKPEDIDLEILNDLLRFTDEESLLSLIEEFVEETKANLQSISFLRGSHKHAEILSILHTIKGNAGSFGFTALSYKAANIEALLKKEKFEKADSDLDDFLKYSDLLLRDYQRLLKID